MKLVIEDEAGTRSIVPFAAAELEVGRAAEGNHFRLADRNVSRRHARFLNVNGMVSVEDLGSLTGTWVNGERIAGRRRLREGDLVEIGDYDLAVVPDDGLAAVAGPAAPPPLPEGAIPPAAAPPAPAPPAPAPPAVAAAPPIMAPRPPAASALAAAAPAPAPPREGERPLVPSPSKHRRGFWLAGLLALLLGGAAGLAVGLATAPSAPPAQSPQK